MKTKEQDNKSKSNGNMEVEVSKLTTYFSKHRRDKKQTPHGRISDFYSLLLRGTFEFTTFDESIQAIIRAGFFPGGRTREDLRLLYNEHVRRVSELSDCGWFSDNIVSTTTINVNQLNSSL